MVLAAVASEPEIPEDSLADMRKFLPHPPKTYTYQTLPSGGEIQLDIYYPASYSTTTSSNRKKYKTLVCWHGGGLCSGSRWIMSPIRFSKLLLEKEWILVFPDYRLLPEASGWDILEDLMKVEEWVLSKAEEMGVDLEMVAVSGASAGVYLAAQAPHSWNEIKPKVLISFYGMLDVDSAWYTTKKQPGHVMAGLPVDMIDDTLFRDCFERDAEFVCEDTEPMKKRAPIFFWSVREGKFLDMLYGRHKGDIAQGRDEKLLLPLKRIGKEFPATVAVHGDCDTVVTIQDANALIKACEAAGVRHELLVAEGAEHGFDTERLNVEAWRFAEDVMKDGVMKEVL